MTLQAIVIDGMIHANGRNRAENPILSEGFSVECDCPSMRVEVLFRADVPLATTPMIEITG